jgi:hypothetical protein
MKTKTNILDTFTTIKQYDFGAMKSINTEEIRKALCVNVNHIEASGCSTLKSGNFTQGTFSDDEIDDLLSFALGGTFGANVKVDGDKFTVTAWNE